MKYILLATSILILFIGCKTQEKPLPFKNIVEGVWIEKWGVGGVETDVDYTDTIKITAINNQIVMSCINNEKLRYSNILFTQNNLKFTMENLSSKDEKFFVYYNLKLSKDRNSLNGSIVNSEDQTDSVKFEKIK